MQCLVLDNNYGHITANTVIWRQGPISKQEKGVVITLNFTSNNARFFKQENE